MQMNAAETPGFKMPLLAMCAILAAHLCLFTPAILFQGNAQEFASPLRDLVGPWLIAAVALIVLLPLPGLLIPARARRRYAALLATVGILLWLQATVLVWHYGLLDGRPIDWGEGQWRGWLDIAIWVTALVATLGLAPGNHRHLYRAAVLVFLVHLVAAGLATWQARERLTASGHVTPTGSIGEAARFSSGVNVLHLLLDGFQADIFEDLVNDPRVGESNREAFPGFVFYSETVSAFLYTQFSVPSFLSGRVYDNSMPKDDYLDEVFRGKTIFNTAMDKGFEVDLLVGDTYLANRLANSRSTNLINIDTFQGAGARFEAARLLELSLFRSAPHFLKSLVYNDQQWLFSRGLSDETYGGLSYFRHSDFMKSLISEVEAVREAPVYKYIHIMNTHRPMVVDGACRYAGRVLPDTRANLTVQSRCTLDTIAHLFHRLKELGLYDDMLIIMHADHGGWVANRRSGPPIRVATGQVVPKVVPSLASPMLAIKLPGATGPLRTLPTLASLLDLPDTVSDVLDWNVTFGHRSLLGIAPDEKRLRRHYFSEWMPGAWGRKYSKPIHEFLIEGSHYEVEWKPGNIYTAPGADGARQ